MNSYNKMIADELNRNVYKYLETNPQPHALSTGLLYGGKRVRDHPLAGHTAYSDDPATLVPSTDNSLMFSDVYDDEMVGGKKYGVSRFVKDMNKISKAIGVKQFLKPIAKASTAKAVQEIEGAGMSGGKKKYGVSRFVKDLNKISKAIGIKQVTKPIAKALTDKAVVKIAGAGYGQDDYYNEMEGAGYGDDEMVGGKKKYGVSRFVKDLGKISKAIGVKQFLKPIAKASTDKAVTEIAGAGRKRGRPAKMCGGAGELYPPAVAKGGKRGSTARGALIKKVMKEQGLNLGQASKYIKEHNLY
jgi:hypothetical protein